MLRLGTAIAISCLVSAFPAVASTVHARDCGLRPRSNPSWRTVVDDTGEYALRLPDTLKPAPAGTVHFIHGGQTWENENITVTLSYGHWAELSFAETAGTRCSMTAGGMTLFVISGPQHVLVWYRIKPGSHEPLVSVRSKTANPRDLAGIALSLRRRKSVAP